MLFKNPGAAFPCIIFAKVIYLFGFLSVQAIKILNMIKLYGKPIRVNKVLRFSSSLYITYKFIMNFHLTNCIWYFSS